MAERADRILMRKRIRNPLDQSVYLDIPVTYQIKAKTAAEQSQESYFYFDNSSNSSRTTRTQRIYSSKNPNQYCEFERIKTISVKDATSQAQEFQFYFTNTDPPPKQQTGENSPAHEQVHYVRYYKDNNSNSETWLTVELIDKYKIHDAISQHQDWEYYFLHSEIGSSVNDPSDYFGATIGYCDPNLPLAPEEAVIDPPYRLDPLQNPVDLQWREPATGEEGGVQWFIFRRTDSLGNGDFYPVSDAFVDAAAAAGDIIGLQAWADTLGVHPHDYPITASGYREKLSDLINAAMSRLDNHSLPAPQFEEFYTTWLQYGTMTSNNPPWDTVQPSRNNLTIPYSVYILARGIYDIDDMATGDWPPEYPGV